MNHSFFAAATLSLLFTPIAHAGQTCVYLIGDVDGTLVTTAGYIISIPGSSADVESTIVHVDETEQTILGYSVSVPGTDGSTDPLNAYVQGAEAEFESTAEVANTLDLDLGYCYEGERSTPAIPIFVPASELQTPGAFTYLPAINFNILDEEYALPGHLLETEGRSIVIPAFSAVIPPTYNETPERTIMLEIDGEFEVINHLSGELDG